MDVLVTVDEFLSARVLPRAFVTQEAKKVRETGAGHVATSWKGFQRECLGQLAYCTVGHKLMTQLRKPKSSGVLNRPTA
jgi:hypothetical protein